MIGAMLGNCLKSIPQRYILTLMSVFAIIGVYMARIVLYISITQMVRPIAVSESAAVDDFTCPMANADQMDGNDSATSELDSSPSSMHEYDWSPELQGYILSSFYVGYVITHLPNGLLAERIGGKPVLLITMFLTSTLSLSTPFIIIYGGPYALIALRFLLGCVQGGMYPSIATLLAAWVPKIERGRIGSIIFCAGPCGTIIGNFTAGLLMHHFKTWQVGFYAFGAINIVTGVLFWLLCASNPASHPFISDEEKAFLQKEIGQLQKDKKQRKKLPWKSMLTSVPVLALILTMVVGDWCYYIILIDLPKYMNDILHVSIKDNGIFSAMPWIMFIVVSLLSAAVVGGSFIMAAAYGGCDLNVVGTFFTIAVGGQGFLSASLFINVMDLAPNYAGVLSGIIGVFGCCMGILVPNAVSFLTPNALQSEWRVVFLITLGANIAQMALFDIWGSAKVQPWNNPTESADGHTVEEFTDKIILRQFDQ